MPFIPHTPDDVAQMLAAIGANSIDELFDEIPSDLICQQLQGVPEAQNEMRVLQDFSQRADKDSYRLSFLGAGAYTHHIPAAVWDIVSRGEFMTAYTPYQAEASQGTLQVIYEYQSMMAQLTSMEASNASLYDGATALAEAVLMAVRCLKGKRKRILMPANLNPRYLEVCRTLTEAQGIQLDLVDFDRASGQLSIASFDALVSEPADVAAVVIAQPNYFGQIEAVDTMTDWAHQNGALMIAVVNPISLGLLTPPGEWGTDQGADICVGEGQPLGVPVASGGPYFGFMCAQKKWIRQMPGRIVGRTVDDQGKPGFTLTLQAREQHIRRSKATSNICTNQGLAVTAATIFMSLLGFKGIKAVAQQSHANLVYLKQAIKNLSIEGCELVFGGASFHEVLVKLPVNAEAVIELLAEQGILAGVSTAADYPELGDALLICTTELHNQVQLDELTTCLAAAVSAVQKKTTVFKPTPALA